MHLFGLPHLCLSPCTVHRMYSDTGHTFCKILISECTVKLVTHSARYSYQNVQWHWSHLLQDTHIRMYSETGHTFCKILISEYTVTLVTHSPRYSHQNVQWHWSHILQDTHIRMYSNTGHTFCKILTSECTVKLLTPSARYSHQNPVTLKHSTLQFSVPSLGHSSHPWPQIRDR